MNLSFSSQSANIANLEQYFQPDKWSLAKAIKDIREKQNTKANEKK